jgi:2'-5' RNA ligase
MDLPADAREALVEWRDRALGCRDELRLVDPAALHMTLVFLGHRPEEEIRRIGGLMRAAVPSVDQPALANRELEAVPPRRPRLFALDLEDQDGRAGQVQAAVASRLADAGLYEPEARPFWPHVTLARVKKEARVELPDEIPPPPAELWLAAAVTLYRSTPGRHGVRYEALEQVQLGAYPGIASP